MIYNNWCKQVVPKSMVFQMFCNRCLNKCLKNMWKRCLKKWWTKWSKTVLEQCDLKKWSKMMEQLSHKTDDKSDEKDSASTFASSKMSRRSVRHPHSGKKKSHSAGSPQEDISLLRWDTSSAQFWRTKVFFSISTCRRLACAPEIDAARPLPTLSPCLCGDTRETSRARNDPWLPAPKQCKRSWCRFWDFVLSGSLAPRVAAQEISIFGAGDPICDEESWSPSTCVGGVILQIQKHVHLFTKTFEYAFTVTSYLLHLAYYILNLTFYMTTFSHVSHVSSFLHNYSFTFLHFTFLVSANTQLRTPHRTKTALVIFSPTCCLAQGRGVARDEQSFIARVFTNSSIFRAHMSLLYQSLYTPSHTSSTSLASWTPSVNYPNLRVCEHLYLWGGTRRRRRAEKNKSLCVANSASVSEYARTFSKGHWSFLGPGCKEKWYGTHTQTRRWMESCCWNHDA